MELTTLERIKKARITIQRSNPFFAYLSLYLKLEEDTTGVLDEYAGMGVNAEGRLIYKKEFVDKLTNQELVGVLVHEILHLSMLHLLRLKSREPLLWNLAADVCVNQIVKDNGFLLPSGCIVSNHYQTTTIMGIEIKDCNKKIAEQIYDELKPLLKNPQFQKMMSDARKKGEVGFDKHIYGKGKSKDKDGKEEGYSEDEVRELERNWKNKMEEAYVTSKLRGKVPAGIERLIEKLHEDRVGWKTLLLKYIQKTIPYDYTYNYPSKKSISSGIYMPSVVKEFIDIVIAVDTSGSIGNEELTDFMSEIVGIAKAFSNRVRMRLLSHDVIVHDDLVLQNGNLSKIKDIKIKGGGGTSHKDVLEYINKNVRSTKLMVAFTDGESDLDNVDLERYQFDKLFVISERGTDRDLKDKGVSIIKLKDLNDGRK